MSRPNREEFMALAIVAALQSDPSGRTVHQGPNPYVPQLNGTFDLLRAARAAGEAAVQWDAAYATEKAVVGAALLPKAPATQRRNELLAALAEVDKEIIAGIEARAKADAAASTASAAEAIGAALTTTAADVASAVGVTAGAAASATQPAA